MNLNDEVLSFFREEISTLGSLSGKLELLELDTILQDYAETDELVYAIDKYDEVFKVDVSVINLGNYYPWKTGWFFRKWFTKEPIMQVSKPLTVRMFAESAKAGKWLYD
ncbi:cytoplasmic protein [Enterobacterales bacterium CwR94]|nr:cytoplasmic protein [Enterobacterales bacterium CwR94]